MSNVASRARKTTHKCSIDIPTGIELAKRLHAKNEKTFWIDAIKKEMHNAGITFEIIKYNVSMPM